jgi:NADH-ubiquinone oxidoreductase chain 5
MYLLIIFLPFLSFCFAGLFGKQLGSLGSSKLTIISMLICVLISVFGFFEIAILCSPVYFTMFDWINTEFLNISWNFLFDSLTVTMLVIVSFVSFLVHSYSIEYMGHDPHLNRFLSYLSLFTFFMFILISSDNLLQMFVGWEGVGLCSYLLINFWFTRIQANKAAIKAMILNRIGDLSLIIGILLIFFSMKSLDYASIAVLIPFFKNNTINFFNCNMNLLNLIGLFLFVGAVGKSAQIGLHTWLPDAMEGPTPVSALIHAATMVTAGVFLIARTCFLFEFNFYILEIIVFIGAFTCFLAATIGLTQNDLKKVVAYSTCSQLGYMIFACGLSNYSVAIFHLTNHAFFKALLFLSAGSVIHSINDEQDMRKMGGLKKLLPLTYVSIVTGSLALMGFPFLTGFYSKDLILETAFSKYNYFGCFSYFFGTSGAFFTAFYSTRLLFLTFLVRPTGYKNNICYSVDSGLIIKLVLTVLIFPSIFIGYFTKDMAVGIGSGFFGNTFSKNISVNNLFDGEFIPVFYKVLPVNCSLVGFFLAFFLYSFWLENLFKLKIFDVNRKIYTFLNKKWFFDKIYNELFGQFFFKFGYTTSYKFIDRGFFEILGPNGLALVILNLSLTLHKLQTNFLFHLTLIVFLFTTLFIFFNFLNELFSVNNELVLFYFESKQFLNYIFCSVINLINFELIIINFFVLLVLFYRIK